MMLPENARASASYTLWQTRSILTRAWESPNGLTFHKFFLREVRDTLHRSRLHFQTHDAGGEHEEIFLPIFDALSFMNQALQQTPVHRESVRAAMDRLNELAELLDALPV
jgi:hypothetical protein